jgi:hypothetical protein
MSVAEMAAQPPIEMARQADAGREARRRDRSVAREVGVPTLAVLKEAPADQRTGIAAENASSRSGRSSRPGARCCSSCTRPISCWNARARCRSVPSATAITTSMATARSAGISRPNCQAIYLVDRLFHGRRSCSVQFFNGEGEVMFKVFVRRDKSRELLADQVASVRGAEDPLRLSATRSPAKAVALRHSAVGGRLRLAPDAYSALGRVFMRLCAG